MDFMFGRGEQSYKVPFGSLAETKFDQLTSTKVLQRGSLTKFVVSYELEVVKIG